MHKKPNPRVVRTFLTALLLVGLGPAAHTQTYAILADRLIDGSANEALANPTVIVRDHHIVDVNFTHTIPDSAIVIDLKGHTLLPGLMDVHTHLLADGGDYDKDLYSHSPAYRSLRAVKHLRIALNNGITTLRDVCSEGAGYADVDLAQAVDSGYMEGPRIFPAGKGIAATGSYLPFAWDQNWTLDLPSGTQYATGVDECTKVIREQYSHGVAWIKLYADFLTPTFSQEEMNAIVGEANKHHLEVAAHATTKSGIAMAITAGARSIEHGWQFNDSCIRLAVAHHTFWCPTLTVTEGHGRPLDTLYKYLGRAYTAHVPIVMGTDVGSFPWDAVNETKELEYYVKKAGLTPMDAIKTATVNPALLLHREKRLGQVKKDFIADLIAVRGNPLDDITLLQRVDFVMKEGTVVKRP
jgi:imidazolonepropionase-like amidohydrolase